MITSQLIKDFEKCVMCIESSKSPAHMEACQKMAVNFKDKWDRNGSMISANYYYNIIADEIELKTGEIGVELILDI